MRSTKAALTIAALILMFQNCGRAYSPFSMEDGSSKLSVCDAALLTAFEQTYHPFVRRIGCAHCHVPGGQKSDVPFAQENAILAFATFKTIGPDKIASRLAEGHQQAVLNYTYDASMQTELAGYVDQWNSAANSCGIAVSSAKTDGKPANIFDAASIDDINKCGIGDPVRSDFANFSAVSWDLGAYRKDLTGVTIAIAVKPNVVTSIGGNLCSHQGYRAGDVTVVSAKPLHIKNVHILLNGENYSVNTFMIDRTIPAGTTPVQLIESMSGGFAVFDSGSSKFQDKWSLYIEELEITQ